MTTWPTTEQYTLAQRCPTCRAQPSEPCDAPRKPGGFHVTRQDAGARHYRRDVRAAPWPEDRDSGIRYDTIGTRP